MKSRLDVQSVLSIATELLLQAGAPDAHAALQAEILVEAEMRGHPSHGVMRLPRLLKRIGAGLIDVTTTGAQHWQTDSMLTVDGQMGLGPVVAMRALDAIHERSRRTGICIAAIRNANHLGMLAYYVEHYAKRGAIVVALSTSEALVHPWGGRQAMLGTNPLAIGIPTGGRPFVLDMATGTVSMGKIHDFARRGEPIPLGWALDSDGEPTTDAAAAKDGSLAPFGDAKGYGLGLALELLVASLAGSALAPDVRGTLDDEYPANKGDVFIVIDPPLQPGLANRFDSYLADIRRCAPIDAASPVSVPGDGADRRRSASLGHGLEIDSDLWASLIGALSKTPSLAIQDT